MDSKQIIDFAQEDNATEFRNALHAAIQDRVAQHIETMKQGMAQSIFNKEDPQE